METLSIRGQAIKAIHQKTILLFSSHQDSQDPKINFLSLYQQNTNNLQRFQCLSLTQWVHRCYHYFFCHFQYLQQCFHYLHLHFESSKGYPTEFALRFNFLSISPSPPILYLLLFLMFLLLRSQWSLHFSSTLHTFEESNRHLSPLIGIDFDEIFSSITKLDFFLEHRQLLHLSLNSTLLHFWYL